MKRRNRRKYLFYNKEKRRFTFLYYVFEAIAGGVIFLIIMALTIASAFAPY